MAGRSPGKSSPGRSNTSTGRCVRELEEQLEELRKENFNLKLKIYFLEERFGRLYGVGEKSDLAKNNIELQVCFLCISVIYVLSDFLIIIFCSSFYLDHLHGFTSIIK